MPAANNATETSTLRGSNTVNQDGVASDAELKQAESETEYDRDSHIDNAPAGYVLCRYEHAFHNVVQNEVQT
jgi:hypothetical protein